MSSWGDLAAGWVNSARASLTFRARAQENPAPVEVNQPVQEKVEGNATSSAVVLEVLPRLKHKECRICLQAEEEGLISPCSCSGTVEYVHYECLSLWVEERKRVRPAGGHLICENCHQPYKEPYRQRLIDQPNLRPPQEQQVSIDIDTGVAPRPATQAQPSRCCQYGCCHYCGQHWSIVAWSVVIIVVICVFLPLYLTKKCDGSRHCTG